MTRPVTGAVDPSRSFGVWNTERYTRFVENRHRHHEVNKLAISFAGGFEFVGCRPGWRAISAATSYVETGLGQLHPRKAKPRQKNWFIV